MNGSFRCVVVDEQCTVGTRDAALATDLAVVTVPPPHPPAAPPGPRRAGLGPSSCGIGTLGSPVVVCPQRLLIDLIPLRGQLRGFGGNLELELLGRVFEEST